MMYSAFDYYLISNYVRTRLSTKMPFSSTMHWYINSMSLERNNTAIKHPTLTSCHNDCKQSFTRKLPTALHPFPRVQLTV
jgi:hypothetical protein